MHLLTIVRLLSLVAVILFVVASSVVRAQYSSDAFNLKKAQDLYDERGFAEGAAVNVDGSLVVSTSNGNVSYTYPISSFTRDGFPFAVSLNYCGSVAHTTYGTYNHQTSQGGGGYTSWQKFTQNRPLWIIGVNGFAIQAISQTLAYHNHPGDMDTVWPGLTKFEDKDLVWTVDGWDVGNRMLNFSDGPFTVPGGTTSTHYRDVIRLLRADGGVLELINVHTPFNHNPPNGTFGADSGLYTGYYVVNAANTPGYAFVHLTPQSEVPWEQFRRVYDEPGRYPRTVHYFPGDGLVYIFHENVEPFGTIYERDPTTKFGGVYNRPSTFYLSQVRSAGRRLLDFEYARQGGRRYAWKQSDVDIRRHILEDSTVGRALCVGFDDHKFSYADGSVAIEALGRTTMVQFATALGTGYASPGAAMPLRTFGGLTPAAEIIPRKDIFYDGFYQSWAGYVTTITDPEGRMTTFDYEPYVRRYDEPGFPDGDDRDIILKNYRLKQVSEPTARYDIAYHRRGPWALDTTVAIDTLTISSTNIVPYPMAFSNYAKSVKKYTRDGIPVHLTTDSYNFKFNNPPDLDDYQPIESTYGHVDEIADDTVATNFWYHREKLDWYLSWAGRPRHTSIRKTETRYISFGGAYEDTVTVTVHDSLYRPYLVLPVYRTNSVNNELKGRTSFEYTFSNAFRTYGGNDTLTKYFGPVITTKRTKAQRPNYGPQDAQPFISYFDEEFLHLPEFDTAILAIDTVWDKFGMIQRFLDLSVTEPDLKWPDDMYDPRIFGILAIDTITAGIVPPFHDLPRKTTIRLPNGTVLGGSVLEYFDVGKSFAGTTTSTTAEALRLRGAPMIDTAIGRRELVKVPGVLNQFPRATRGRPEVATNVLGATTRQYFSFGVPGPYGGTPWSLDRSAIVKYNDDNNDTITLANTSLFGGWYELPMVTAPAVRRFNSSGILVTDTLPTFYERTYFGQVTGSADPNGWYSRYAYDRNGRLNTVWLPYDHQSRDSGYRHAVNGVESGLGMGYSTYTVTQDTLPCEMEETFSFTIETVTLAPLHVGRPAEVEPGCIPCPAIEKVGEASTQAPCGYWVPYTTRGPATGTVSLSLPREVNAYLDVDSVWATLTVTGVIGECVTVEVRNASRPSKPLIKTLVFNCPLGTGGAGADTILSEKVSIDLTALKDSIIGPWRGITLELTTSTTDGYVAFTDGVLGEDVRPRLHFLGEFLKTHQLDDYTVHYEHDDGDLTVDIYAKVDDSAHTANRLSGSAMLGESRRTRARHNFGADYRLLFSESFIGDPTSWFRVDTTRDLHDGDGTVTEAIDAEGDLFTTEYDALGRPTVISNPDATYSTIDYFECAYSTGEYDPGEYPELEEEELFYTIPCYDISVADQDFYGYVSGKTVTNENDVKFTQYFDAFDRLRREVADSGGLHRITRYEYDVLGRMTRVVNPAGDTIRYWYDNLGRVRYKKQADQGTVSYAYDKLGNLRFSQTEEQQKQWRMTFYEYDDLNRLRLIGETMFDTAAGGGHPPYGVERIGAVNYDGVTGEKTETASRLFANPVDDTVNLGRVTDLADPNVLHDEGASTVLTANKTLVLDPATYGKSVPQFWNLTGWNDRFDKTFTACSPLTTAVPSAQTPYMYHPAPFRDTVNEYSTLSNFEHLAKHPENGRTCVHYDRLPDALGPVWKHFPSQNRWDSLMPTLKVRNLKGREAAVAYREHAGQPYHFAVMSYDERGRVEAVARYTENVGFEVVYYTYNSMNQVTAVRLLDPFRQHVTWYGYDRNGRVDSVWTTITSGGSWGTYGLNTGSNARKPGLMAARPTNADIFYTYTRTNQIDTMAYPAISVLLKYHYDQQGRLDTLRGTKPSGRFFEQFLTYDYSSRVTKQRSVRNATDTLTEEYFYDDLNQLVEWDYAGPTTTSGQSYQYDSVGNRVYLLDGVGLTTSPRDVHITGRRSTSTMDGPNQMVEIQRYLNISTPNGKEINAYDPDGALALTQTYNTANVLQLREKRRWGSWRGLPFRYRKEQPVPMPQPLPWDTLRFEWEYRYNAMGEREQKREILHPGGATSTNPYRWTYYGLSGSNQQLSVWNGIETNAAVCGSPGLGSNWVWMAPTEYLTYSGATANIVVRPSSTGGTKEYLISDRIGSNRVVLDAAGSVIKQTDYEPFGKEITGTSPRKGFIDREQDSESGDGNLGVRQYDESAGRFSSIDPLWEGYTSMSPYNYAANAPTFITDPSGLILDFADDFSRAEFDKLYAASSEEDRAKYDALRSSRTVYFINLNASLAPGYGGGMTYNFDMNRVDVLVQSDFVNKIGALGEELSHASDFDLGTTGVFLNGGEVEPLGYDAPEEAESKRAFIRATDAYNASYGTNLTLDAETKAFQAADSRGRGVDFIIHSAYGLILHHESTLPLEDYRLGLPNFRADDIAFNVYLPVFQTTFPFSAILAKILVRGPVN